jgi:hypothetical protein
MARHPYLHFYLCPSLIALVGVAGMPMAGRTQGNQYFLIPGAAATVVVDSRITVAIHEADLDGRISDSSASLVTGVKWMVNGKPADQQDASAGTLRAGLVLDRATYTAPHSVPATNPVAVSVTFTPGPGKAEITLICNVTVRDQGNFVTIDGPGTPPLRYELDDRYSSPQMRSLLARGMSVGPELQVSAGPLSAVTKTPDLPAMTSVMMTLLVAGKTPGTYQWSVPGSTATTVMLLVGSDQYLSVDCQPHGSASCQTVPLSGSTQITSVDATNAVRGSFSGQVVQIVAGKPTKYFAVTGGFNVALQGGGRLGTVALQGSAR